MNDLDICKRIAEIEGVTVSVKFECDDNLPTTLFYGTEDEDRTPKYNPLTDDALCFQLMVKYKITVEFTRYYEHLKSTTVKAFYDDKADNGYGAFIRDINPNKAICLAIIEAHKEQ